MILVLSKKDLEELLSVDEVLDALETGFREVKEGRYTIKDSGLSCFKLIRRILGDSLSPLNKQIL
jgi:ornithine cyclodeaminase/alanine dehydrogenase-like protein (mu-crystallin family)